MVSSPFPIFLGRSQISGSGKYKEISESRPSINMNNIALEEVCGWDSNAVFCTNSRKISSQSASSTTIEGTQSPETATEKIIYEALRKLNNDTWSSQQQSLDCPVCRKEFRSPSHCKRHLLTHTKQRPWKCHICGKSFTRDDNLRQHIRKKHFTTG